VELYYSSTDFGGFSGASLQMVTPVEKNLNKVIFQIYTECTLRAKLYSKLMLLAESKMVLYKNINLFSYNLYISVKQLERDVIVWNNKKNIKNPIFTKADKSLVAFRRWFKQFY